MTSLRRFSFIVQDGTNAPVVHHVHAADPPAARLAAVRFASGLLTEEIAQAPVPMPWRLDVADETGTTLFQIKISTSDPLTGQ